MMVCTGLPLCREREDRLDGGTFARDGIRSVPAKCTDKGLSFGRKDTSNAVDQDRVLCESELRRHKKWAELNLPRWDPTAWQSVATPTH